MTEFLLYCGGEDGKKGDWSFRPGQTGLTVADPDGQVVCRVPHGEVYDRFVLPSFWRSIKNIGFNVPGGGTVQFAPNREDVAAVKEYLDTALASQGVEGIQRLRKRGGLHVLAGLGLLVLSLVLCGVLGALFGTQRRAAFVLPVALLFGGIGETVWGASALVRASRARRRLSRDGDA